MGKPLDVHTGSEGSRLRMHVDDYAAVVYASRRPRPSPPDLEILGSTNLFY